MLVLGSRWFVEIGSVTLVTLWHPFHLAVILSTCPLDFNLLGAIALWTRDFENRVSWVGKIVTSQVVLTCFCWRMISKWKRKLRKDVLVPDFPILISVASVSKVILHIRSPLRYMRTHYSACIFQVQTLPIHIQHSHIYNTYKCVKSAYALLYQFLSRCA